jgi:hypothetical protein
MSAPLARIVDQYSGRKATQFFKALSEADEFVKEVADMERLRDENAELHIRVQELETELAAVRAERDTANAKAARRGW